MRPFWPKEGIGFAGRGIECVNKIHHTGKDAFVVAIAPISQAAIGLGPTNARVKFPEKFSGGGVQGKNFLRGSNAVQNAVDNDGVRLQAALFTGIKTPGDLQIS